jgi:DmsE family decaheme c-type cytochrome
METKNRWKAALGGLALSLGLVFGLVPTAYAADNPSASGASAASASASGNTAAQQRLQRDAVCTKCHDESETRPILAVYQRPHGAVGDPNAPGCQSCHGESKNHVAGSTTGSGEHRPRTDHIFGSKLAAGYAPDTPQEQSDICLSCHKGGLRMRWPGSQHEAKDVACTSCHVNHRATDPMLTKEEQPSVCFTCHQEKRAEIKKISAHPVEAGKMACSDCHNPHGSAGPKLLAQDSVNETCFECHADKRGPFLWEHQPVTENCANCHNPHGSNITPLLKSRPPFLCQECHDGPHSSPSPAGTSVAGIQGGGVAAGGAPSIMAAGRACMNCHVMVHGSNSPAGAYLHR